jgi:L-aminopeptidase/D-esterase-like protein
MEEDYTIGALVINNAVGNPLLNEGPHFLSGFLEIANEFGGYGASSENYDHILRAKRVPSSLGLSNTFNDIASNTVIAVIATDAPVTRANLKRMAMMAHDGIAKSLSPAHTPMDGDTIFAISSNEVINKEILEKYRYFSFRC